VTAGVAAVTRRRPAVALTRQEFEQALTVSGHGGLKAPLGVRRRVQRAAGGSCRCGAGRHAPPSQPGRHQASSASASFGRSTAYGSRRAHVEDHLSSLKMSRDRASAGDIGCLVRRPSRHWLAGCLRQMMTGFCMDAGYILRAWQLGRVQLGESCGDRSLQLMRDAGGVLGRRWLCDQAPVQQFITVEATMSAMSPRL
jgi:hypothetical protein